MASKTYLLNIPQYDADGNFVKYASIPAIKGEKGDNTYYTFEGGVDKFTVTPSAGGETQTINIDNRLIQSDFLQNTTWEPTQIDDGVVFNYVSADDLKYRGKKDEQSVMDIGFNPSSAYVGVITWRNNTGKQPDDESMIQIAYDKDGALYKRTRVTGEIWELWASTDEVAFGTITKVVDEYGSRFAFPSVGDSTNPYRIYVATNTNQAYRWDAKEMRYIVIGSDWRKIHLINCGGAGELDGYTEDEINSQE